MSTNGINMQFLGAVGFKSSTLTGWTLSYCLIISSTLPLYFSFRILQMCLFLSVHLDVTAPKGWRHDHGPPVVEGHGKKVKEW